MAYVTDAAREYAKKKMKDAKHTFEEIKDYISENVISPDVYPEIIEHFEKNGRDYIRIATDEVELTFAVDYDEDTKIENLSMLDLTRKNLYTNKIDKEPLENMPLSEIHDLLISDASPFYIRENIRQLIIDRDDALMAMYNAYRKFMNKWEDKFDDICRKYNLGYPGAYNDYLIELQDLDDMLYEGMKPLTDDEINEQVEELLNS